MSIFLELFVLNLLNSFLSFFEKTSIFFTLGRKEAISEKINQVIHDPMARTRKS